MRIIAVIVLVLIGLLGAGFVLSQDNVPTNEETATVVIQNYPGNKIRLITLYGTVNLPDLIVPTGHAVEAQLDDNRNIIHWENVREIPPAMLNGLRDLENSPNTYELTGTSLQDLRDLEIFIAAFSLPPSDTALAEGETETFTLQPINGGISASLPPISQPMYVDVDPETGLPNDNPPFMETPESPNGA